MRALLHHIRLTLLSGLFACASATGTVAQQSTNDAPSDTFTETFEAQDASLILGGQIDLRLIKAPWVAYMAEDRLVLENRQNPNSLHFNDISWIRYPGSAMVEPTEGAVISAIVGSETTANAGVGILIGSGIAGSYLMFAVDDHGKYYLLQKDGRTLRLIHSAPDEAIRVGAPNEVSFEPRGGNVIFRVNGSDILEMDMDTQMRGSRRKSTGWGIGIAAFGLGSFFFDSVVISKG